MHHIYTTESIILRREPSGDSAYYYLLTHDLGLIRARAQGVRESKSRLKGTLQEYSRATVAFVHAKAGWKITTAIPDKNFYFDERAVNEQYSVHSIRATSKYETKGSYNDTKSREVKKIIARISDCLIRLITGEEKNKEMFIVVSSGFDVLSSREHDVSLIEVIIMTRVLHLLGYIGSDDHTFPLLQDFSDFSAPVLSHTLIHKSFIVNAINRGFKESQL